MKFESTFSLKLLQMSVTCSSVSNRKILNLVNAHTHQSPMYLSKYHGIFQLMCTENLHSFRYIFFSHKDSVKECYCYSPFVSFITELLLSLLLLVHGDSW